MKLSFKKFSALVVGLTLSTMAVAQNALPLKIATYPGALLSLPEMVGAAEGIYTRNGLNVSLIPIPTGPEQIAAVASGSVDLAGNTVGNALLAIVQGQDLVVVTNSFNIPLYTWLKQPGFNMPNLAAAYPAPIKDFKGARIGISTRGSEVELFTRILLADAGLDANKDVIWVAVGFGQPALAAFEAKQVDILVTIEPVQTMLLAKGVAQSVLDLRGGGGPDLFKVFPGQSRIAKRSVTVEKGEAMKRFIKAQGEVLAFIGDVKNADAVAGHYSKASGLPLDIAKRITGNYRTAFGLDFDCRGYSNVLKYLERSGQMAPEQIKKTPPCESLMAPVSTSLLKR